MKKTALQTFDVKDRFEASTVAGRLVCTFIWFQCEPLPDGVFRFMVGPEVNVADYAPRVTL